jgi:hypothetical protein
MAFILSQKSSYTWPVKYGTPKDAGKIEKSEFMAEFKRLPQSRLDAIQKQALDNAVDDDQFIGEILIGWSGIKTPEGEEVLFNEATRSVVLDLAGMRAAIVQAFFDSIAGAARKN